MQQNFRDNSDRSMIEGRRQPAEEKTQILPTAGQKGFRPASETPPFLPVSPAIQAKRAPIRRLPTPDFTRKDVFNAHAIQEEVRQLCLAVFSNIHNPVRSLGFTSSVEGEGKSFLALVAAQVLARDSANPVTLLDCNWEHPSMHEHFGIPLVPGLAEWLRGMCSEADIRYQVGENLFVLPAGNGSQDAAKLLKLIQRHGLLNMFRRSNELFIADLPPVIAAAYGSFAAQLLDAVVVVVRAQAVPDRMIAETCARLGDARIHGLILNQEQSRIPRWLGKLL